MCLPDAGEIMGLKKLAALSLFMLGIFGFLYAQEWQEERRRESAELYSMFMEISKGLVYCYSTPSKTTGTAVKKTKEGTWFITAQHKVDRDFPEASKIYIKENRERNTKVYKATEVIVPDNRGLDLLLFFVPDYKAKYIFKRFRTPYLYEENWVFGFRGGADKVPGSPGYVTEFAIDDRFIFSSASIWYGCSGSPVINRQGDVLGIAVQMAGNSTDTLFISGKIVKEFIKVSLAKK